MLVALIDGEEEKLVIFIFAYQMQLFSVWLGSSKDSNLEKNSDAKQLELEYQYRLH